jgi:uncharacterized protein (TIGR03435 family)
MRLLLGISLAALPLLSAQDAPRFDVASVKPVKGPITHSADPAIRGRAVFSIASSLYDLVEWAYGVRRDQIVGEPAWATSEHYDIEARADGEGVLALAQARQMMQSLLAERFHLEAHRESRERPVYLLVVGKSGPKFKPSAADATGGYRVQSDDKGNHMDAKRTTMEQLAVQLSVTAGRPVIDTTGLVGRYVFKLDWFPANRTAPPVLDMPDMFAALDEQLGLKLEAAKAPIEMLIIDRAERPSEN